MFEKYPVRARFMNTLSENGLQSMAEPAFTWNTSKGAQTSRLAGSAEGGPDPDQT